MRVLIVGATGTIGKAVAAALGGRHDLILASHEKAAERVDIAKAASIEDLFARVGRVDGVVSAAGRAAFKPLGALNDADFELSLRNKLMEQVNLVRIGLDSCPITGRLHSPPGIFPEARHLAPLPSAWSTRRSKGSGAPPRSRRPAAFA